MPCAGKFPSSKIIFSPKPPWQGAVDHFAALYIGLAKN
jgi:hypothetical protein